MLRAKQHYYGEIEIRKGKTPELYLPPQGNEYLPLLLLNSKVSFPYTIGCTCCQRHESQKEMGEDGGEKGNREGGGDQKAHSD